MPYRFLFTPAMVGLLQKIERLRTEVSLTVLPPAIAESLRQAARIRSTHYSTRIEGNRLALPEAERAVMERKIFPGRERDTLEVQHYYQALNAVEKWVDSNISVTEQGICKLHAMIYSGKRARPTPYRDGQNVIRDGSGAIVYLPPEAKDVPGLMQEMVQWIQAGASTYPIPVVAGVVHYQFVTIHPFYDGNGRTARALATWILYRGGYDLGKFYALEEFYARDLGGYYQALVTHPHHNYYEGRANADITSWLEYFLGGMTRVFETVVETVRSSTQDTMPITDPFLRALDRRGRIVLGLFAHTDEITSADVSRALALSLRQSRAILAEWVGQGWLTMVNNSRKGRKYVLTAEYRRFIGGAARRG